MVFSEFTGQYPLSKTLRFELIPQGKTEYWIEKNGLLASDAKKARDYQDVKKIIDNYHKFFIDSVLERASFDWDGLENSITSYRKDKTLNDELSKVQKQMRNKIAKLFSDDDRFSILTAATPNDLFKTLLPDWLQHETSLHDSAEAVSTFKKFSTYFTGFQENRRNVYSSDEIATSVPYRIVHDNFPKFLQNVELFNTINDKCPDVIKEASNELTLLLGGKKLTEIFSLSSYNSFLTQKGIDVYNQIIGGISEKEGEKKIRGINELLNLYWQQNPEFARDNRKIRLVPLYKQIMSDRSTLSFIHDSITSDNELIKSIVEYTELHLTKISIQNEEVGFLDFCRNLLSSISDYSQEGLFIDLKSITEVSRVLFGNWDELNKRMYAYALAVYKTKAAADKWVKSKEFSFAELDKVLSFTSESIDVTAKRMKNFFSNDNTEKVLESESLSLSVKELIKNIENSLQHVKPILESENEEFQIREDNEKVELIKNYLDDVQKIFHRIKPLKAGSEAGQDTAFYSLFEVMYENLSYIIPLYSKVRNYLTKKVFEEGKYKLNFDAPTLASGWDENKEDANSCVLLKKNDKYFLGVMNTKNKPKMKDAAAKNEESFYEKMVYKLLPGPNKMLPKVFFSKKGIENFDPPAHILNGYNAGLHKKGETFDKSFCHQLIDFFKDSISIHPDWKAFNFKFSDTSSYNDISDFYKEVSDQGYKVSFQKLSKNKIFQWIDDGRLYLFQIYNKDFSEKSTGTKNLHTLYWESLFSKENLDKIVFKLNGEAELFYRPLSIKNPVIHRAGEKVVNRTTIEGYSVSENIHSEVFKYVNKKVNTLSNEARTLYENKQLVVKEVSHEITKDRRYTTSKYLFHVPITINFTASERNSYLNERVRKYLKNNEAVNIIGLDRGERNLIYMTIIDRKGNILLQKSFNTVEQKRQDKVVRVNYHEKLNLREQERDAARKSWKTIGKIAELKEGYLSAVIHEIAELMIEYNAVITMEDLNFGFKRGRFHVEKQIYQKFEKMLIDKLNYLVFKDKKADEEGGVLNGYQLTEKFESFQKMGKQSGFLFYVPAGYTSKIDPITGFVNMFELKGLTSIDKKRDFFAKLDSLIYDSKTDSFIFSFDYKNFGGKAAEEMKKTKWAVYSKGKRIVFDKKTRGSVTVDPTKQLKELFTNEKIAWEEGNELLDVVLELGADNETLKTQAVLKFYDTLYRSFSATMQMRNSNNQTGEDYIISPVCTEDGIFYDSREELLKADRGITAILPIDADANGAYHIALKGLYLLNQFDKTEDGLLKKIDMRISNVNWFSFRQH